MPKRWSKLKAQLAQVLVEDLNLRFQCTKIRKNHRNEEALATTLGVFTVHLGKLLLWDFPKQFVTVETTYPDGYKYYSYTVSDLNQLLRDYLDTPRDHLLTREFGHDYFGLCHLLRAADRRLSQQRLGEFFDGQEPFFVRAILEARGTSRPRY